jgi:hypothetical protein
MTTSAVSMQFVKSTTTDQLAFARPAMRATHTNFALLLESHLNLNVYLTRNVLSTLHVSGRNVAILASQNSVPLLQFVELTITELSVFVLLR